MENILLGLILIAISWHFWYQRTLAETAKQHVQRYCQQANLQLLTINKSTAKLIMDSRKGLIWRSTYEFEFSGDGENRYKGQAILLDKYLLEINTPAYKI